MVGHRFGGWLCVDPDPEALQALEWACLLEQAGSSEEAIVALSQALEAQPGCAALFAARGALYVAATYPGAGAGDFRRALALAPENARLWFALGHAYEAQSLSHQARAAFERAASLGDGESEATLALTER